MVEINSQACCCAAPHPFTPISPPSPIFPLPPISQGLQDYVPSMTPLRTEKVLKPQPDYHSNRSHLGLGETGGDCKISVFLLSANYRCFTQQQQEDKRPTQFWYTALPSTLTNTLEHCPLRRQERAMAQTLTAHCSFIHMGHWASALQPIPQPH